MTHTAVSSTEPGAPADALLDAVRAQRSTFEGAARRAEEERTLPVDVVETLRELELFWLKTPTELGGSELDPLAFCDVLEEIAYYDASAGWSAMVGNGTTGCIAAWLPDDGIAEIFTDSTRLPVMAGQFTPRGTAVPDGDGYRVTGRWSFCSGIRHSEWVVGGCLVDGAPHELLLVVVPKNEATVHDTWHVAGLSGTGSDDFSLTDTFVPAGRTCRWFAAAPVRGGLLYQQPRLLFLANELSPVMIGIARRAIDDMYEAAATTTRRPGALADRTAFLKDISIAESRVRAAQLLYRDAVAQGWDLAATGPDTPDVVVTRLRAQHTLVAEECLDAVARIFRYAGGRALRLDNPLQRHLRNLTAAMQHIYISDENYEAAGRARITEVMTTAGGRDS
jgi:alkylation response protein AidB-like acyl-CoA dehydrogenase